MAENTQATTGTSTTPAAPVASTAPAADTAAFMGMGTDAPAPSQDAKTTERQTAERSRDGSYFGVADATTAEQKGLEIVRNFRAGKAAASEAADRARDTETGRFIEGTSTPVDEDRAPLDPEGETETPKDAEDEAGAETGDLEAEVIETDAKPRKGSRVLAAFGVDGGGAEEIEAAAAYADRLVGMSGEDPRRNEPNQTAQPAAKDTTQRTTKPGTFTPYTDEQIAELEESEGKTAGMMARQLNLMHEQMASQRQDSERRTQAERQQADQKAQRDCVDNVILPAVWKLLEDAPALKAMYGAPNRPQDKLLDREIGAMLKIEERAGELMDKSHFDPNRRSPLTFQQAFGLAIAQLHKDDITKAMRAKTQQDTNTVRRHGQRTLTPSGGASGTRRFKDATAESNDIMRRYRESRFGA